MKQDYINETEHLRQADVNLRKAVNRMAEQEPQLPADFVRRLRQKPAAPWRKLAATFIGLLVIAGVTFASIAILPTIFKGEKPTGTATQPSEEVISERAIIHFSNARLDSILTIIARQEKRIVCFQNDNLRQLRFTISWDKDKRLADFLATINEFEGLLLTDNHDTIFVSIPSEKSDKE